MATEVQALEGRDLTIGNIHNSIWYLATPMILEMVAINVAMALDTYWVGQLGEAAMAAVTVSMTIRWVINSLANGLGIGGMATVARRIGEKDPEAAARAAGQTILLGIAISLGLALAGSLLASTILSWMGADADVMPLAVPYLRITLGGLFTMVLVFVINAILRGAGEAKVAMQVLLLSSVAIAVLEPTLVLGLGPIPALGIAGAAWAFVLGYGVGVIMQIVVLLRGKHRISIDLRSLRPDFRLMGRIIQVAFPSTVQMTLRSSSRLALVALIGLFGTEALAAYGVTNRLLMFAIIPCFGMGNAGGALVGQNLGAEKPKRAERTGWWVTVYTLIYISIVAALVMIFARPLINFFVDHPTPEVMALSMQYAYIVTPSLLGMAAGIVLARDLDGAGNTTPAMVINLISLWGVEVAASYVLSRWLGMGAVGVWWGRAAAGFVNGLLFAYWFKLGKWKKQEV